MDGNERSPGGDRGFAESVVLTTATTATVAEGEAPAGTFYELARWATSTRRPTLLAALSSEWFEHLRGAA